MSKRVITAALLVLAIVAPISAHAGGPLDDPKPRTPAWYARSLSDYLYAQDRGIDMEANLGYQLRFAPLLAEWAPRQSDPDAYARVTTDPYRLDWGGTRGTSVAISYKNRYGAGISGHVWVPKLPFVDPVTKAVSSGPFPGVVLVNGYGSTENMYWGIAQSLAEDGYVVMTFDPQGQGRSDFYPDPRSTYCDQNGTWREPQEMGITEQGPCAGIDPMEVQTGGPLSSIPIVGSLLPTVDFLLHPPTPAALETAYAQFRARFVFGALDAMSWFLSSADPERALIDATRVGVAGHSAGADAALHAGNGDPLGRFTAAVTFDGFGQLLPTAPPRVPTMFQHAEEQSDGPFRSPPAVEERPGLITTKLFRNAAVDTMAFVLRGSTHQEWTYIPHPLVDPFCVPFCNASRLGQEVALYYAQAWFDRYLKGHTTSFARGDETAQAADADRRLTASVFDGSVDGASIGTGTWDPRVQANVGYTIANARIHDNLSVYFPSSYAFDGYLCGDMYRGC